MKYKHSTTRKAMPKRNALVVALAVGMGISGLAFGQATTGAVFGSAPAGDTVQVANASGVSRTVTVNQNGGYTISSLPAGTYTVTLMKGGSTVSTRTNVNIKVGGGVAVNFASQQNAQQLGQVTVTASALPAIDVTTTNDSTTITAAQLQKLPVGRGMTNIALLTPGTMVSTAFGGITFGGSSQTENAYYVNGYNTGEPYRNLSGFQLPYGAIQQQQTMAGAFGAKYGRSDGGVISQIGKSGTNQWHFGAQVVWEPESLESSPKNTLWPNVPMSNVLADGSTVPSPYQWQRSTGAGAPGTLYNYNNDDKGWSTVYTAYIGGPLIKDKLFFFLDAEYSESAQQGISSNFGSPRYTYSSGHEAKYYGKINWNINENNLFELTYLSQEHTTGAGAQFDYDYATMQSTTFEGANNKSFNNAKFYIAKYTSYLSDNATLQITYGSGDFRPTNSYAVPTTVPFVTGRGNIPASLLPVGGIQNPQTVTAFTNPDAHLDTHGLRVDFTYLLGDHDLMAGIDNMKYRGQHQGSNEVGSAGATPVSTLAFLAAQGVNLPGGQAQLASGAAFWEYLGGNFVFYESVNTLGGMDVRQKAWYLQDKWQVTPNILLNIGVRNDSYSNYTGIGQRFIQEKNQWEPRIGVSWNVFGDSSLKIYANAGRYYLALPLNAANRAADISTFLYGEFTFTGISQNGVPIITPSDTNFFLTSPDGEYGTKKDVDLVVSQNIKPMYVDQFHLGFDAKTDFLGTTWTYGAKLSYRETKTIIDDECDPQVLSDKITSLGLNAADYYNSLWVNGYCRLFNPGSTSKFIVKNDVTGDPVTITVSPSDFGWQRLPIREYKGVDLYFAHPFDGKWSARVDYTYANAKGNTVGQVRPDIGQLDVSKTEDWDNPALMAGAYGELPNVRKQILRIRGSYQITPEWTVSLIARIQSGQPLECLGYYSADPTDVTPTPNGNTVNDPSGYNGGGTGSYHWCMGQEIHRGSDVPLAGHTPWLHVYNMSVDWTPAFADHKLDVQLAVFNLLNEQNAEAVGSDSLPASFTPTSSSGPGARYINPLFHLPVYEAPRSVRLTVSYNY